VSDYQQAIDILAFIQRHPGHASQKPHGRRYGASGEALPAGHKRKDVVKGNKGKGGGGGDSAAANGKTNVDSADSKAAGSQGPVRNYKFQKNDRKMLEHYDIGAECRQNPGPCAGITAYTKDSGGIINSHLRGKLKDDNPNKVKSAEKATKQLDKAFEVMPTVPENMKVARFVNSDVAGQMSPGTIFKDKGFISTTLDQDLDFEGYEGTTDWKIHINVPKGSKGIYVAGKSKFPGEQELLLPRGSQMLVTGKDPSTKTIYADYQ